MGDKRWTMNDGWWMSEFCLFVCEWELFVPTVRVRTVPYLRTTVRTFVWYAPYIVVVWLVRTYIHTVHTECKTVDVLVLVLVWDCCAGETDDGLYYLTLRPFLSRFFCLYFLPTFQTYTPNLAPTDKIKYPQNNYLQTTLISRVLLLSVFAGICYVRPSFLMPITKRQK